MLQAQEQAWLAMAGGSGGLENLPTGGAAPGGSGSGAEPGEPGEGEGGSEDEGEELSDEEMARQLQEQEEREFQARLLALAGVAPGGSGAAGGDDGGDAAAGGDAGAGGAAQGEGYLTEDEVDPDELTYEEVRGCYGVDAGGRVVGEVGRARRAQSAALPSPSCPPGHSLTAPSPLPHPRSSRRWARRWAR
jgi:E3 ubiquitin-protein ligase BIG BROTHER-like protein